MCLSKHLSAGFIFNNFTECDEVWYGSHALKAVGYIFQGKMTQSYTAEESASGSCPRAHFVLVVAKLQI